LPPRFSGSSEHDTLSQRHLEWQGTWPETASNAAKRNSCGRGSLKWRKLQRAVLEDGLCLYLELSDPFDPGPFVALESAGVPLPGETILVAAALLAAATNQIDIGIVVAAAAAGAIIGDGIGYTVGRRFGMPLLRKYGHYIRLDENRLLIGR